MKKRGTITAKDSGIRIYGTGSPDIYTDELKDVFLDPEKYAAIPLEKRPVSCWMVEPPFRKHYIPEEASIDFAAGSGVDPRNDAEDFFYYGVDPERSSNGSPEEDKSLGLLERIKGFFWACIKRRGIGRTHQARLRKADLEKHQLDIRE